MTTTLPAIHPGETLHLACYACVRYFALSLPADAPTPALVRCCPFCGSDEVQTEPVVQPIKES